jgi:hypothetical protein
MLPVSLVTSYVGMETSLLILLIGVALAGLLGSDQQPARLSAVVGLGLMPWTRPDAVLLGGLCILFAWWQDRRFPWKPAIGLALGLISAALFNVCYFGAVLNQTIIAKSVCYHPSHSPSAILKLVVDTFVGNSKALSGMYGLYLPLNTHFLMRFGILFLSGSWIISVLYGRWSARRPRGPRAAAVIYWLIGASIVLPIAYCAGGIIFPWYLWPAQIFGQVIVAAAVITALHASAPALRRAGLAAVLSGVLLLAIGQACLALCTGTQEYYYRAGIGRYLHDSSQPTDTLLLEPTGYIPFFADRYTWDDVGLVAPQVTGFQRRYGLDWWFEFVQQRQPTYVIQRTDFIDRRILYSGQPLSPEQRMWFDSHYSLDHEFQYDPADYWHNSLLLKVASMASATRYGVYRLRRATDQASGLSSP